MLLASKTAFAMLQSSIHNEEIILFEEKVVFRS